MYIDTFGDEVYGWFILSLLTDISRKDKYLLLLLKVLFSDKSFDNFKEVSLRRGIFLRQKQHFVSLSVFFLSKPFQRFKFSLNGFPKI